jgi:hypothetical protein
MEFKRSGEDPKCFTAYTCLEKVIELCKKEILGYAKKHKDVEKFNAFMQTNIYDKILVLMHVLTPPVRLKGLLSINNSISKRYFNMKQLFIGFFDNLPDLDERSKALSETFRKTIDEQKNLNVKNTQANRALGFRNQLVDYEQLNSDAADMLRNFKAGMKDYKNRKKSENKITFQYGNQLAVLCSTCRPSSAVRSKFEKVPEKYKDRLGSISDESYTTLTEDDENISPEKKTSLKELKQSLVLETGILKKKKTEATDTGSIRMVNFISVDEFLHLIRDINILWKFLTLKWTTERKKDGESISVKISDAVSRDVVLMKYQKLLIEKINGLGKQTKSHVWRAIGAAVSVYRLTKDKNKKLFGENILSVNNLYAILLAHKEFSHATQAYQYLQCEGLSHQDVVKILSVSESRLVVEMYSKLVQSEKENVRLYAEIAELKTVQIDVESRLQKLEKLSQPKKTTDESIAGKFPNDTKKKDDADQKQTQRDFYNKVVEHLDQEGVTSRSWETIKRLNTGITRSVIEWIQLENRPSKKQKIDI